MKAGDWDKLSLQSLDTQLMKQELGIHYDEVIQSSWEIAKKGIHIEAIHQVKQVSGKRIALSTPLLYPIDSKLGWKLRLHPTPNLWASRPQLPRQLPARLQAPPLME